MIDSTLKGVRKEVPCSLLRRRCLCGLPREFLSHPVNFEYLGFCSFPKRLPNQIDRRT